MRKIVVYFLAFLLFQSHLNAQGKSVKAEAPNGWHLMDHEKDGYYGISLQKAYDFIKSKNLKSKTVVVAVIDSGIDTLQEDLKGVLWVNPKEIPGNGTDDDHNGYIDDIHGWNYLGGKDGTNVKDDASEEARVYYQYKARFEDPAFDTATLNASDREIFMMWKFAKQKIMADDPETGGIDLAMLDRIVKACMKSDSIIRKAMGKEEYTGKELIAFQPATADAKTAKSVLQYLFQESHATDMANTLLLDEFKEELDRQQKKAALKSGPPPNYRQDVVKDDETDLSNTGYGNADIMAADPMHGTHVSGIIAAQRGNGVGIDGIADNVKIMLLRVVPNGDEHDKDIALAIRYAVDNGAKVINMSFGKSLSPHKKWIDDAVMYAESKNVLLVHAAGNDAANVDTVPNFPNPDLLDAKRKATNWITVGASSDPAVNSGESKGYIANFSNYGKNEVDVFAPGTKIYSTLPGKSRYGNLDGTSMATPVVSGIAALLFEYFPSLSASQVKACIEKSALPPPDKSKKPGQDDQVVSLSEISKTGGIVNAYGAAKMAAELSKEPNTKKLAPKSTLSNRRD